LSPDGDHFPANTLKIFTERIGWNRDRDKRKRVTHYKRTKHLTGINRA
jgi:hypothetical protein